MPDMDTKNLEMTLPNHNDEVESPFNQTESVLTPSQDLVEQLDLLVNACTTSGLDRQAMEFVLDRIVTRMELQGTAPHNEPSPALAALTRLGDFFETLFESSQEPWYINQAIKCHTTALSFLPDDDPEKYERIYDLGILHLSQFERLGDLEMVNAAINYLKQVASLTADDHPNASRRLNTLGVSYSHRFERFGKPQDINEAIDMHNRAVVLARGTSAALSPLNNLAGAYMTRYQALGDAKDLDPSIDYLNQAIRLAPENYPHLADCLGNLGSSYLLRFKRLQRPEDLHEASLHLNRALSLLSSGDWRLPQLLCALGTLYADQFEYTRRHEDLMKSLEYNARAVSLMPNNHPRRCEMLANLGNAYKHRFRTTGDVVDINQAISYQTEANLGTSVDNPGMPRQLAILGVSYLARFDRLANIDDVNQAIDYLSQAIELTPKCHSELPNRIYTLGRAYCARFNHSGQLPDLGLSIEWLIHAVTEAHTEDPNKPSFLNQVGVVYLTRFRHGGDPQDICKAIEYFEQAISLTSKDYALGYHRVHNLGNAYSARFEHYGDIGDIDKSIQFLNQALLSIPQGDLDMPVALNNLGKSHFICFERLNEGEDNDRAIILLTQAINLTPEDSPDQPGQISNLGASYLARFQRLGNQEDVNKAIELLTQGSLLLHRDHPDLPCILDHLGVSYRTRFSHTGNMHDIDQSLIHLKRALLLTPDDHRNKPSLFNSLCTAHLIRFKEFGNSEDSDQSINCIAQAISTTPDSHPDLAGFLLNCGQVHFSRFKKLNDYQSLQNSVSYFQKSAEFQEGYPRFKFDAARIWARTASSYSISDPLKAYNKAMEIVPQLVWLGSTINQRYEDVKMIGDLATEAAAAAIQAGRYTLALEWLEQGRSIVWNQILQLRTPLDELRSVDPLLADKIASVANKLHSPSSQLSIARSSYTRNLEQAAQEHRQTALEYEKLLSSARALPGFADFLRPKKAAELVDAPHSGPVVIVNTHESRCDALILLPKKSDVLHLPLSGLSYARVLGMRVYLERSLRFHNVRERELSRHILLENQSEEEDDDFRNMLEALWIDLVKPVLAILNYLGKPATSRLPHITWCTTGALTFLPLHAAGLYSQPHERTFEFVISSYTPTISALIASFDRTLVENKQSGILTVGQEQTPGQSPLPGTVQELLHIQKRVVAFTRYTQLDGYHGTASAVLAGMESHSWVHLACHGSQQVIDPTESGFFLHDDILSLAKISQRSFTNKGLAFLSACQTAKGDSTRPDEAVHLACGMLMAGYPSVIATMWSIIDDDAPLVADSVYGVMMEDGRMDCKRAAEALHIATTRLREKVGEMAFVNWVPYIHVGVA
ncbi:hypothetical protein RSOLAG1IB_08323 [Rhizoctonia solani AG-1 IB]|uniref:CHAT domain-containing protein n=1 Tax=Thanatephorus cucumeris (strain AG1-IB / isolate 7/3/14) TaxID=1108050 RepID=A0A0B7FJM1_THACB|nr:hypothetical protein RSOLAG1IB_08323 [Rhizoctonia solani AG-1 IB]